MKQSGKYNLLKNFNINVDADSGGSAIALPGLCPGELKRNVTKIKNKIPNSTVTKQKRQTAKLLLLFLQHLIWVYTVCKGCLSQYIWLVFIVTINSLMLGNLTI